MDVIDFFSIRKEMNHRGEQEPNPSESGRPERLFHQGRSPQSHNPHEWSKSPYERRGEGHAEVGRPSAEGRHRHRQRCLDRRECHDPIWNPHRQEAL